MVASRFLRITYLRTLHRTFPWCYGKLYPPAPDYGFFATVPFGVKEFDRPVDKRMWRRRFPELIPLKEREYWAKLRDRRWQKVKWAYDDPLPGEFAGPYYFVERALMARVFAFKCAWRDRRKSRQTATVIRKVTRMCRRDKLLHRPAPKPDSPDKYNTAGHRASDLDTFGIFHSPS